MHLIYVRGWWDDLPPAAKETPELLHKALLELQADYEGEDSPGLIQQMLEMLALMQKLAQDKEHR